MQRTLQPPSLAWREKDASLGTIVVTYKGFQCTANRIQESAASGRGICHAQEREHRYLVHSASLQAAAALLRVAGPFRMV